MAGSPTNKVSPNLEGDDSDRRANEIETDSPTDEMSSPFQVDDEIHAPTPTDELEKSEVLTDASSMVSVHSEELEYFMKLFHEILCQIIKHKWAFPFLKPVDAVGLGLDDYYEVIRKPMDLGTILDRMVSKEESSRYKNMNDIRADVRLVFTNAMQYSNPGSNAYIMAQELRSKFEKMWYPLSLEVGDELVKLCFELDEEHREGMKKSCLRNLSIEEKYMLSENMFKLSPEDLRVAMKIAAKYDPNLDVSSVNVNIDLDSLDMISQWMLFNFVVYAFIIK